MIYKILNFNNKLYFKLVKTTIISIILILISNSLIAETYKCMYVCELYGEPVCKDEFYREGDKFNSSLNINFSYKENDDFLLLYHVDWPTEDDLPEWVGVYSVIISKTKGKKDFPFKKSYNAAYSFDDVKNYGLCDVVE